MSIRVTIPTEKKGSISFCLKKTTPIRRCCQVE
jgi:hypothetical protein